MRPVKFCHNRQLRTICQQAIRLDALTETIRNYLPDHLSPHCLVSAFQSGCLHIQVNDPIWATELRYEIPALRDILRKEAKLYQLIAIKLTINTTIRRMTQPARLFRKLSSAACETIKASADQCTYLPLKEVLLRIAERETAAVEPKLTQNDNDPIPFVSQVATRRTEEERASLPDQYMSTRSEVQQSCSLKDEGYKLRQSSEHPSKAF